MKKNLYSVFTRVNTMVGVIVLLMLTGLMPEPGYSQIMVGFQPRTSISTPTKTIYNVRGDFTMIGNTNMTLQSYCVDGDDCQNGNNTMIYVDIDGDANTLNSSSAVLDFSTENGANPACSNIIYAGLYWTGRAHNTGSTNTFSVTKGGVTKNYDKSVVYLKHANAAGYTTITASDANFTTDIYYPNGTAGNMYSAYAEVTDYVRQYGVGNYFVADIALREGSAYNDGTGYYGGWGLVVIYENSKMSWRDITLFDGHAYVVGNTTVNYNLPVSGFSTTLSGDVNMKLGMMAGEGDRPIAGDYFQIINQASNWVSLSHAGNATTNFFNSSIFTGGNARNPNLLNNTGMDISMFAIPNTGNSIITNNQSSTTFRYGSTQDTYIIFCIAMAVDAYRPEPEGLNTLATINGVPYTPGMQALPGQTIVYQLEVRNKGTEPINNAQVVIPMPYSASYVSSSASFTYTPVGNSAPIYDAGAGATGSIVWDLGTLPLPADPDDLLATLTYTLQVTTNCVILSNANCEVAVTVDGIIEGTGATSNIEVSDVPFIQGYTTIGECEGEPIYDPVNVLIDAADYVNQNCQGTPAIPDFAYCNFPGGVIPVTEVLGNFPVGSRFYNEYPPDEGSTEYTIGNPFPATPGTITYYAVPPGITDCYYEFTITVTSIDTSPDPVNPEYCQDDTAVPLTATPTDPAYTLYYYTTSTGGSSQLSITPSTATPGITNYWVAEGVSTSCVGPRVPITVTVHPRPDCLITGPDGPVCPLTAGMVYSAPAGMSSYIWSVSGNATIVGADNTQTVSVTAGSGCNQSFTLNLTVTNSFGCSRTCQKEVSVVAPEVEVTCATAVDLPACTPAIDIQAAYTSWVAGFSFTGGCGATSNIAQIPTLPLDFCDGVNLSFTYTASDNCSSDECTSTFIVAPAPVVEVTCATAVNLPACTPAVDIQAAYTSWVAGFSFTGGCGATSNIAQIPTLPADFCDGVNLSFTYTASDNCSSDECTSTFIVAPAPEVEVTCAEPVNLPACTPSVDIQAAYTSWVAGFGYTGGCNVTTNIGQIPQLPANVECIGANLSFTYMVDGDCEDDQCTSTFVVA
ncbi:MAG: hypothetical protein M9926_04285, partial [Lentimicrobium sp.]|uniref:hypothetical protein n=1 Tax=Lentimicrobium sp. TaxID=2034841 RepID=UPI0025E40C41